MTQGGQSLAESTIHRSIGIGWSSWLDPATASHRWPRSSNRRRRRYATGSTRRTGQASGTTRRSFTPQRILCVADASPVALGRGGSGAAGAHTPDPRRVAGHLRCASNPGKAAGAGRSRESSQDRPPDGEGRASRGVPAPSLDHHGECQIFRV